MSANIASITDNLGNTIEAGSLVKWHYAFYRVTEIKRWGELVTEPQNLAEGKRKHLPITEVVAVSEAAFEAYKTWRHLLVNKAD